MEVAIVGSGFGGLGMAINLKRAGIDDFTIFERAGRLGGTWRDNTYPGAACDVPSHLYSFSFEPKHDWSRMYAEQPEILAYLEHCADKYDVRRHIRFDTEIEHGELDEPAGVWRLRARGGERFEARILVTACGQLNRPAFPRIEGIDRFAGTQFHSARWNHDYDLDGKRVAVIGTGASAIQFVPKVAERARQVTIFQRSPPWVIPKKDRVYTRVEKSIFRHFPFVQAMHRYRIYWQIEGRFVGFGRGSWANRLVERLARRHMKSVVTDPELQRAVIPDYPIGCKRILISNDYLQSLGRDNVDLVTGEVTRVVPEGVMAGGTLHPADAIIYGTGFHSTGFLAPMTLTGRGGRELNDAWRAGAEALFGISVAGFPNLFILYGPNTNLAHNSIIFMLESQIRYVMACLKALASHRFMDLKPERLARYEDEMRTRLERTVWNAGCHNWYRDASGRNTNNWPGFTVEYRLRTRRPDLQDYDVY